MRRTLVTAVVGLLLLVGFSSQAFGHYLWVTISQKGGSKGIANVYFEGGPGPGTGEYLDPFVKRGKTWVRTIKKPKPTQLKIIDVKSKKKKQRWLSAYLNDDGPRSVDSFGKWGVYKYGKDNVLLHYSAQHIEAKDTATVSRLDRAKNLALNIVATATDKGIQFQLLFKDKPQAGRTLIIRGPSGFRKNIKTDKNGKGSIAAQSRGQYVVRTNVERKKKGEFEGKKYNISRHHATLIINMTK